MNDYLIALQASAGSGKTFALSVRVVSMLFNSVSPQNILALTFTNKAANEMKNRIYQIILEIDKNNFKSERDEILKILNIDEKTLLSRKDKVLEKITLVPINISTIDAFFTKVLRQFSFYVGLMPDFLVKNLNSQDELKEVFLNFIKDENLYESLSNFSSKETEKLDKLFEKFDFLYQNSYQFENYNLNSHSYPSDIDIMNKTREIKNFLELKKASNTAINSFNVNSVEEILSKNFLSRNSLNYRTFSKVFEEGLDENYIILKDLLKKYCIEKENYMLYKIFKFYKIYEKARFKIISSKNELNFSDILRLTYEILNKRNIDSDFLYFRLDGGIYHLLIDEFQDTSSIQFKILKPIIEEIVSGIGTKDYRSFFYVGDVKQSIYRFRGANKRLFKDVKMAYFMKEENLEKNYRSYGVIVNFVNEIFSKIKEYDKVYIPQLIRDDYENKGFLKIDYIDEISQCVKEVQNFINLGINLTDIAILCWKNDEVEFIKDELNKQNIKTSIESNVLLVCEKSVKILIEFIRYCYFKDEIFLKNTLLMLGKNYHDSIEQISFDFSSEVIEILKKASEHLKISNFAILRLCEISLKYKTIEEFLFGIDEIDEMINVEKTNGVNILSIHKSKGLEFNHVIVLDKFSKNQNSNEKIIICEQDNDINIFYRIKNRKFVDENYAAALEEEEKLSKEDSINASYVAITRAKKSLIVLLSKEKSFLEELLFLEKIQKGEIESSEKIITPKKLKLKSFKEEFFGYQDVKKSEKVYSKKAQIIGLATHFLLEIMPNFTQNGLEVAKNALENKFLNLLTIDEINTIYQKVNELITNHEFLKLIKNATIYKEQPLMFNKEKKQIDILLLKENECIVMDYKSTQKNQKAHKKQMDFYKNAIEEIFKKEVKIYLIYLHEEKIKIKAYN